MCTWTTEQQILCSRWRSRLYETDKRIWMHRQFNNIMFLWANVDNNVFKQLSTYTQSVQHKRVRCTQRHTHNKQVSSVMACRQPSGSIRQNTPTTPCHTKHFLVTATTAPVGCAYNWCISGCAHPRARTRPVEAITCELYRIQCT